MNQLHHAGSQWDLDPVVDVLLASGRTLRIVVGAGVAVVVDA